MPYAVTHIISAGIAADMIKEVMQQYGKKYVTMNTVLVAAIAGILPDIDIALNLASKLFGGAGIIPGTITHSFLFAMVFILPGLYFLRSGKKEIAFYFFAAVFGLCFHIILDFVFGGGGNGVMMFWPLIDKKFMLFKLGYFFVYFDTILLIIWIIHEIKTGRIRDFV